MLPEIILVQPSYFVHETAVVDEPCKIGEGTRVWHFSHVSHGCTIGRNCNLGQNVFVAPGVVLGNNVKVQNNVSIFAGTEIESDVFLGPSCVVTNVTNPRSQIRRRTLYERTFLRRGATIGANATIISGITIGRYAFVAAGSVVTRNVADYALIMGVPGRPHGWMSRHGHRLPKPNVEGVMVCPESGFRYREEDDRIWCLDLNEESPLPSDHTPGSQSYNSLKAGK